MRFIVYLIAGAFALLTLWAQSACSMFASFGHQRHGPEGDVWMLWLFASPVGVPAAIAAGFYLFEPSDGFVP